MTTDHDGEQIEDGWGEESSLDWYFDLPTGAWERQEAKNRDLRDRLRRQAKEQPPERPAAFSHRPEEPLRADTEGLGRELPPELDMGRREEPVRRLRRAPEASAFETEAEDAPPPLILNRHRGLDPAPAPMSADAPSTFFGFDADMPPAAEVPFHGGSEPGRRDSGATEFVDSEPDGGAFADWSFPTDAIEEDDPDIEAEGAASPGSEPLEVPVGLGAENEWKFEPETDEQPTTGASAQHAGEASRWDEMLSSQAGDGNIIEGMRAWATSAAEEQDPHKQEREAADDEAVAAERDLVAEQTDAKPATAIPEWAAVLIEDEPAGPPPDSEVETARPGLLARIFGKRRASSEPAKEPPVELEPEGEWIVDGASDRTWIADTMEEATAQSDDEATGELVEVKDAGVDESEPAIDADSDEDVLAAAATLLRRTPGSVVAAEDAQMTDETHDPQEQRGGEPVDRPPLPPKHPPAPPPPDGAAADDEVDPWAEFLASREESESMPQAAGGDAEDAFPFAEGSSGNESGSSAVPVEPGSGELPSFASNPADANPTARRDSYIDASDDPRPASSRDDQSPASPSLDSDELSWDAIVDASGVESDAGDPILPPGIHRRGRPVHSLQPDEWERNAVPANEDFESPAMADITATAEEDEDAPADEPLWIAETGDEEDDVVLRAFEQHAAEADLAPEADEHDWVEADGEEPDLRHLLGDDHETLVGAPSIFAATVSSDRQGWAPQRTINIDEPEDSSEPVIGGPRAGDEPPLIAPWEVRLHGDDGNYAERPATGNQRRPWVRELIETGLLAILVFLAVRASFQNFRVDGQSMFPTLENGQYIIVNKLSYSQVDLDRMNDFVPFISAEQGEERYVFGGPERGDIVVFNSPRNPSEDLIKRVIGLPNETIEIRNGQVYINDRLLEEPYIDEAWAGDKPKVLIPPGEYFVMGDNRNNSQDSRSSQVGLVPESLMIGKATLSYLPLHKFGLAPNGGAELSEEPVLTAQTIGD